MSTPVLSACALNRATLARQLLLARDPRAPLDATRHLVGLQAQVPHDPYAALWSRLDGFRPETLSQLLEERAVVRTGVMRGTIHLVTADDCLLLRPLVQPVFEGSCGVTATTRPTCAASTSTRSSPPARRGSRSDRGPERSCARSSQNGFPRSSRRSMRARCGYRSCSRRRGGCDATARR